jgi:hypothetical protein
MLHSVLGRSFEGRTDTCSKCGHAIPEDAVPLMLFGGGRSGLMWVYCEDCEGVLLKLTQRSMKSKVVEGEPTR